MGKIIDLLFGKDKHDHDSPPTRKEWDALVAKIDNLLAGQAAIQTKEVAIMATQAQLQETVDATAAKIEPLTNAAMAAAALLASIKKMLDDALASGGTPDSVIAQVQGVADAIGKNTDDLAAAVAANTPSA